MAEQRPPDAARFAGARAPKLGFGVECSFCEVYCEDVTDLLDAGGGRRRALPVVEDRIRGWHAWGLTGAPRPGPGGSKPLLKEMNCCSGS